MSGPWERYSAATPSPAPAAAESGPWSNYGGEAADQKAPPPAAELHTFSTRTKSGKTVSFQAPVDASDAEIRRLAVQATGSRVYSGSAIKRDGTPLPRTDDGRLSGIAAGALKPLDKAASWLAASPVGEALDSAGRSLGLPTSAEAAATNADWRANNSRTGYQTLGEIAGTLPLARLPGGLAAQGAASGALLSDASTAAGTARDAAAGAAGGLVGGKIAQGLGSLATGVKDAGLRALNDAGIPLTLGQIAAAGNGFVSKAISKGEEALTSVPFLGDLINTARGRGTEGLNVALGNRILSNVGDQLPAGTAAGHEMIDAVQKRLGIRYEKLVPNLTGQTDQLFQDGLQAAADLADQASRGGQLAKVVDRVFGNRFQGGTISGKQLKDAESELTRLHGKYKNAQGDEGLYGEALDTVRQALRGLVERSNPDHAAELQGLNRGWAQLKALRGAVSAGGANSLSTGLVTPAQALRASTRGGYRDELLEAAQRTLPNSTPDSGTARRAAATLGTLAAGGGAGAVSVSPALAVPAAASLLYTKAGQRAVNATAFGNRPALVRGAAAPLNALSRYAPQAVTPLLVAPQE